MKSRHVFVSVVMLLVLAMVTGTVLAGSLSPRHDFTEATTDQTQTEYAVVTFTDPPAASYEGGINGLARTRPERGQKLNAHAAEVVAYAQHLREVHAQYQGWLNGKAPRAEIVREFVLTHNAVVVKLNGARANTLSQGPGVRYVERSWLYQPTMNTSVELVGAHELWPTAGGQENAGQGVKVGVIDSGIDDTHEFFACKDEIQHRVYASGVAFDTSNVLVNDHGTHVAGTIGGCVITLTEGPVQDTISGVAPAVELYDYNVFPGFGAGWVAYDGSAFSHDIAAALEDAVADGMDVVNLSLGGTVQGPHDFLAEALDATVDAGVVAAVAAGNEGPGEFTIGSPGSAPNALTAAASTNSHVLGVPVDVEGTVYVGAAGDFDPFVDSPAINATLSNWAATGGDITACSAAPNASAVAGTVTLISRGGCTFTTKVRNAQNAGAVGVVVYNNVGGPATSMGSDGTTPEPTIPAVMVSNVDGAAILAGLPSTATIQGPPTELPADPYVLAGFSSRGPTPFTYLVKPDVTAPGVNIYSSVINDGDPATVDWAAFQGTSMATPHLAGSAAVLVQLHPDWSPFDVKSAIVNSAIRVVLNHTGADDAGPLDRGNGHVWLPYANTVPVTLDPVSVSFGYFNGNSPANGSVDVAVKNVSGGAVTCDVSVSGDHIAASASSVSLAAGETGSVTFTFSGERSNTTASGDYSGDISLDCGDQTLTAVWWARVDREAKP